MSEVVTLKNTTGVAQSVVYKGRQIVLPAHDEQTFEADIAKAFLDKCSPLVVDTTEELGKTYAPELEQQTIWLANMTGNPDAPETLPTSVYDTKIRRWTNVQVRNPNKDARDLSRELKGNHRQYTGRDGGMFQETLPSKIVAIPKFRRRPLPKHEAEWFEGRDQKAVVGQGACIRSRPPSDFEPDMKWKLDDMRVYFRLVQADASLGLDSETIRSLTKQELEASGAKEDDADYDTKFQSLAAEKLRAAKQLLYRRLYFRLVDPTYRLPTRQEFDEFVTGKSAEEVTREEVAELLKMAEKNTKRAVKAQATK